MAKTATKLCSRRGGRDAFMKLCHRFRPRRATARAARRRSSRKDDFTRARSGWSRRRRLSRCYLTWRETTSGHDRRSYCRRRRRACGQGVVLWEERCRGHLLTGEEDDDYKSKAGSRDSLSMTRGCARLFPCSLSKSFKSRFVLATSYRPCSDTASLKKLREKSA